MALRHKLSWFLFVFALAACQQAPAEVQSTATSTVAPTAEITATPTLSPDQLINLAQDASNRGDWQGAILLLDLAITQDPASTQILLLRGNAYREAGDFDQAITNYDQALAIDPELAAVYHNRALAYVKFGDPDAALVDFAHAIEIAPTSAGLRNRAELQLAAGNSAAAALDLEIYITLNSQCP